MNFPDDFDNESICRAIAKGVQDAFREKLNEFDGNDDWLENAVEQGVISAFSSNMSTLNPDALYDIYEKAVKDSVWEVEDAKARGRY